MGPHAPGGIQLSGRLAWEGIVQAAREQPPMIPHLFCYAPGLVVRQYAGIPQATVATSQLEAIWRALHLAEKVDLVVIWHMSLLRLLPFLRIGSARVVLMLLGIEAWRRQDPLTRLLLPRINTFLSISDYTWQRFLTYQPHLVGKPRRTLYLGLDSPSGQATTEPAHPPVALIISRLLQAEDYKGHRELIAAWVELRAYLPDAQLWIAGDGDLRPVLEHMVARLGLADQVRFFGSISEAQKQELLLRCRCLAMPSRGEGFGLVYLEAMRHGRPCLVSDCDAAREVVNPPEAGLAVNPADRSAIVAALRRLLSAGPEWAQWSQQARHRYESGFTARHFQERLRRALSL